MQTRTTTANALEICNACEADDMHPGCAMGYCQACCPADGMETNPPDVDPVDGCRATFNVDTVYTTRFATDADSRLRFEVVKRTARFVTVQDVTHGIHEKPVRVGIKTDGDGNEYALPMGSYSMAPVIRADRFENPTRRPGQLPGQPYWWAD